MVNRGYTLNMLNQAKKAVIILGSILALTACQLSEQSPDRVIPASAGLAEETLTPTPSLVFPVVVTNTPKSFPSSLQGWLMGSWQQVSTGEHYHFTNDFELILKGDSNLSLGYYRFVSENELLMTWNNEIVQAAVWQLDQNSMLINFPDGLGIKFIRVSS